MLGFLCCLCGFCCRPKPNSATMRRAKQSGEQPETSYHCEHQCTSTNNGRNNNNNGGKMLSALIPGLMERPPHSVPVVLLMALSVLEMGRHMALLSWTVIVAVFSNNLNTKYAFLIVVTAFFDAMLLTIIGALTLRSLFRYTAFNTVRWYQRISIVLNLITLSGRFETVGVATLQLMDGGTNNWAIYTAHSIDMGLQLVCALYRAVWLVRYARDGQQQQPASVSDRRHTKGSHCRHYATEEKTDV